MADENGQPPTDQRPRKPAEVGAEIGKKADRKLEARRQGDRGVWFGFGMFGLIGWAVAVPTLIGIAIGLWLDERYQGQISWTLTFLFIGAALGCLNAWYWIDRESRHDRR